MTAEMAAPVPGPQELQGLFLKLASHIDTDLVGNVIRFTPPGGPSPWSRHNFLRGSRRLTPVPLRPKRRARPGET
jgi:hypothetical protein